MERIPESKALANLTKIEKALEHATTLPEVKAIIDIAESARVWARNAKAGEDAARHAETVKLKACRKAGQLLSRLEKGKGGGDHSRQPVVSASEYRKTLEDAEIEARSAIRWQQVGVVPERKFSGYLDDAAEQGAEVSIAGLLKATRREINAEIREQTRSVIVPPPTGKYSCIVIDPPWPMEKIERDERPNQVGFDYPAMSEEQLAAFAPMVQAPADDCHLYLWTTHKFLPMALRLTESWGFNYQCLMTWVKNVGFTPFSWMYSTEHVLFCRRGNLPLLRLGMRLDFSAKVREHSRKPEEFYDLVRAASPEPRLDIFGRERRDGFDVWGNEATKFDAA